MKETAIVNSTTGKLKGYLEHGLCVFKGIPYAQPPINELRFRNPVEKEPWDGILEAVEFGSIAPQPDIEGSSIRYHPQSEDCLTLNIWTPACDNEVRPVMFWIHGGGFHYGGGPSPRYNGKFLSQRGNICVVTINYRLGALGNLYVPDEVSNLGFMDQVAALKWVHDNISHFGGDPNNITIFGESAGSTSVCTLLSMPAAKPFIRRAICQSGALDPQAHDTAGGMLATKTLFSRLGLKPGDINSIRKINVEKLIKKEAEIRTENWEKRDWIGYPPIIDENKVPEHPLIAINKGASKKVDLLIGTNFDENTFFSMLTPELQYIDWSGLTDYISMILSKLHLDKIQIAKIINEYKCSRNNPFDVLNAICTDFVFRYPSIKVAEAQVKHNNNTFMYLFTYRTPVLGGNYGATHALEIPFVFGTLDETEFGVYPKRDDLNSKISELMMDSWISFARSGNPSHKEIPPWPTYDLDNRKTLIFGNEIKIVRDPLGPERLAMETLPFKYKI